MDKKTGNHNSGMTMSRNLEQPEGINYKLMCVEDPSQKQYSVQELVDKLYDHIWIEYLLGYNFREIKAHILKICPNLKIVDGQNFKPRKIEDYFFKIERKGRVTGSMKLHFCRKHGILSAL